MIERVISGGQAGADLGAWRAARRCGIATGGWMPKGFLTEVGPRPEFADLYGAREHESADYPPRTRANILEADFVLIFETARANNLKRMSPGTRLASSTAQRVLIPHVVVKVDLGQAPGLFRVADMAQRIINMKASILFVGGNRESRAPGIGAWVVRYLVGVFMQLGLPPKEEDGPYCVECGEDRRSHLAYQDRYANGERWRCKTCGHEFQVTPQPPEG